jgi:CheY-like chemotaxis protein
MSTITPLARTGASVRALVVDDDPMMRELLTDMLGDAGIRSVSTADSGAKAQHALQGATPDVVLCDLHMPDGDGFLFMEALAQRGFQGGVILVSGMDERVLNSATLMARFHRLKILATLAKPVQATALSEALNKLA